MKNHIFLLAFVLITVITQKAVQLELNAKLDIQIKQGQTLKYKFNAPDAGQSLGNLYLHAYPIFMDPLQVPSIFITADQGYTLHCYNAHIQFSGVCTIPNRQLKADRIFYVEIKSITNSKIRLQSYFSKSIHLGLGTNTEIHAKNTFAFYSQNIVINVPIEQQFNKIVLLAQITNLEQNIHQYEDAVDLFINYGESNVQDPNENLYKIQSEQFNGGGRIAYIDSQLFQGVQGNKVIKAYLKIKSGISVNFHASKLQGNKFDISLGNKQFGYSNKVKTIQYNLPIQETKQLSEKTIQLMFDIFSGKINIEISFNRQYNNSIQIQDRQTSSSILITPAFRKQRQFKNFLIIKISSQSESQYMLFPTLTREDINIMESYYTYFDQLQLGQITNYLYVEKFKYIQGEQNEKPQNVLKNYSLKVEFKSGDADFYLRRCSQLQGSASTQKLSSCILDQKQLKSKSFTDSLIPSQKIWNGNILNINMEIDVRHCLEQRKFDKQIYVTCAFQLIIVGSQKKTSFSFQMQRKYHINYLRQNKISKEYIYKGNYAFYSFYMPNLDEVREIDIVMSTYSGQTTLLFSTVNKMPTLQSTSKDIIKQTSIKHNLIVKRQLLKQNIYLSIYSHESTEINIGIIVRRVNQINQIAQYPLPKNSLQYKSLKKAQNIRYKMKTKLQQTITVFVNDITGGALNIRLYDSQNQNVKCQDQIEKIFFCSFTAKKDTYYIELKNQILPQATFTVLFKDQENKCIESSLNMPLFYSLNPFEAKCFSFNLNRLQNLRYTASFTDLQKFNQVVQFVQVKSVDLMTLSHNYNIIPEKKLQQICPKVLKDKRLSQSCEIIIYFQNSDENAHHFNFVLSQQDLQIVMFDGINQEIIFQDPNDQVKHFYYLVSKAEKMSIFITSPSNQFHYFVVGKFVARQQFLNKHQSNQSIYLQYVEPKERQQKCRENNVFCTSLKSSGMSTIAIQASDILPFVNEPHEQSYFVLSVYLDMTVTQNYQQRPYFDLQITQKYTYLRLGQSKIGHINKDQIYAYRVDQADGLVSFNMINKAQDSDEMCLSLFGTNNKQTIMKHQTFYSNYLQINKFEKIETVFVHGKSDDCSFQINFISNANPFLNVKLSHPYQIALQKEQMKKFIYYNRNMLGFQIIEMASAGSAYIYIKPIKQQEVSFKQLLEYKLQDFPIKGQINGKYSLSSQHQEYCTNCNYYIVISTKSRFIGQVVFLKTFDPIPLTTNHILKQHLVPQTQNHQASYTFFSKRSFTMDFNIFSGKIKFMLKNSLNVVLTNQDISASKSIVINIAEQVGKPVTSMFNSDLKYRIFIQSIEQSSFTLQIKRDKWNKKILSGYPAIFYVNNQDPETIQFMNSDIQSRQFDIMVQIQDEKEVELNFSFSMRFNNGAAMQNTDVKPINIQKSEGTYLITLPNNKATYYMDMKSEERVAVNILLIEKKLNKLVAGNAYQFSKGGVYQVNANHHNVLVEAYNCQGQLTVEALSHLNTQDKQSKKIELKKPNYGGHYVFGLQPNKSSSTFYILVNNKQLDSDLKYKLSYFEYGLNAGNPYDRIDAKDYDISYETKEEGFKIKINPPVIVQDKSTQELQKIKIKSIGYRAYASASKEQLIRYTRCSLRNRSYELIQVYKSNSQQLVLKFEDIKTLIKDDEADDNKTISSENFYLTIEVSVEIQTQSNRASENFPSVLTYFYNTLQMPFDSKIIIEGIQNKKYWFTDSIILFVIWLVLPFMLAMASLFYLLRFCIMKLMNRQIDMVEEIDIEPQVAKSLPSQTTTQSQVFTSTPLGTVNQLIKQSAIPESGAVLCKQTL